MRFKKNILFIGLIAMCLCLVLVGCSAEQAVSEEMQSSANNITEKILIGMNENDYLKFSEHFDQQMKSSLSESQFMIINKDIKNKIGSYVTKEYMGSEKKDGYYIVLYRGKFSQEKNDVIIKTVLSENSGKIFVSGFWLDSPNLRQ